MQRQRQTVTQGNNDVGGVREMGSISEAKILCFFVFCILRLFSMQKHMKKNYLNIYVNDKANSQSLFLQDDMCSLFSLFENWKWQFNFCVKKKK